MQHRRQHEEFLRQLHELADRGGAPDAAIAERLRADPELGATWARFQRIARELPAALDSVTGKDADSISRALARVEAGAGRPHLLQTVSRHRWTAAAAAMLVLAGAGLAVRQATLGSETRRAVRSEVVRMVDSIYAGDQNGLGRVAVPARLADGQDGYVEQIMDQVAGSLGAASGHSSAD